MDQIADEDISVLPIDQEYCFIVGKLLLMPMFAVIGIFILIILCKNRHHSSINADTRIAVRCAIMSVTFSIICLVNGFLLSSDFIIPWDFSALDYRYCDIIDFISNFSWVFGKIFFYAGFTHHVLQCYHPPQVHRRSRAFLKIWMCGASVMLLILIIVYFVDDAMESHMKEIGKLPIHNIYVSMDLSHEGANYAQIAFAVVMVVDMVYVGVLLYFYIKQLISYKQHKDANQDQDVQAFSAIRGLILVLMACAVLWICSLSIAFQSPMVWIFGPLDIICDDIMLSLMFEFNSSFYVNQCGCVHRCVSRLCFAGKGYRYIDEYANADAHESDDTNDEHEQHYRFAHESANNNTTDSVDIDTDDPLL